MSTVGYLNVLLCIPLALVPGAVLGMADCHIDIALGLYFLYALKGVVLCIFLVICLILLLIVIVITTVCIVVAVTGSDRGVVGFYFLDLGTGGTGKGGSGEGSKACQTFQEEDDLVVMIDGCFLSVLTANNQCRTNVNLGR